jgi:hypothetical protein
VVLILKTVHFQILDEGGAAAVEKRNQQFSEQNLNSAKKSAKKVRSLSDTLDDQTIDKLLDKVTYFSINHRPFNSLITIFSSLVFSL